MRPVDTSRTLTFHQRGLGFYYIIVAVFMILLGSLIFWLEPEEHENGIVWAAIACIVMGFVGLAVVIKTRRRAGQPFLILSPAGIRFELVKNGQIAWSEVTGLGSLTVMNNVGLTVQITDTAHARIVTSRTTRTLAQADKALLGVKGLTVWNTQIDTPLDQVATMICAYSDAHGGPDLWDIMGDGPFTQAQHAGTNHIAPAARS